MFLKHAHEAHSTTVNKEAFDGPDYTFILPQPMIHRILLLDT